MKHARSSVPKTLDFTIYSDVLLGVNKESDELPQN